MKNFYKKMTIVRAVMPMLLILLVQLGYSQENFPMPDQALTFDKNTTEWVSTVPDGTGNNDALWWTYREGTETMYGGYRPEDGKFGGAWYMSGYHICCEEMASPSMDFILLAGSNNQKKDAIGFRDTSELYHRGFESLTVAFWFKSDRDYSLGHTPCPPDQVGMHEQELLFSLGSGNSLAIQNFKGYYEVRLNHTVLDQAAETYKITYVYDGVGAANKEWQHIAVTFDGINNGALAVYIDGALGVPYLGDPNPLETGLDSIPAKVASVELGAQTGGGPFGNVSDFWGAKNVGEYCLTAEDTTYRTGWPAAGYFDDFVFYKDKVLNELEINMLANSGISNLVELIPDNESSVNASEPHLSSYIVYPNPATDFISIKGMDAKLVNVALYDILGAKVLEREVNTSAPVDISMIPKGLYFLEIDKKVSQKIIIQ